MQKPGLFGMNGFLLFLLTFYSVALHAQQEGSLILIDAENKQAFTVRIGDQLFSSTGQGQLVLAHLKDSVYRLNLRFPKKNLAEQVFPVTIHEKDLGFLLKGADSSWVLYNWQTKETIHPVFEKDSARILEMGVKREDGFSRLMAAVVNDTAVLYNTYSGNGFGKDSLVKNQLPTLNGQPPADSLMIANRKTGLVKDSSRLPTANRQPPPAKSQPPTATGQQPRANPPSSALAESGGQGDHPSTASHQLPAAIPEIKKLREVNLKISRKMVFLDKGIDGKMDTITLFVYYERVADTGLRKKPVAEAPALQKPSFDSTAANGARIKNKPGLQNTTGNCGQLATEEDTQSLRSAILQANTEHDKITAASGAFAQKCFTVSQIRLLASLFISDKARYQLMDAARGHIADRDHFRELGDMYTDKNFQKKFLVMAERRS